MSNFCERSGVLPLPSSCPPSLSPNRKAPHQETQGKLEALVGNYEVGAPREIRWLRCHDCQGAAAEGCDLAASTVQDAAGRYCCLSVIIEDCNSRGP